jgi:hypothetical protein
VVLEAILERSGAAAITVSTQGLRYALARQLAEAGAAGATGAAGAAPAAEAGAQPPEAGAGPGS